MRARLSLREIDVLAAGRDAPPRAWVIDGLLHTETLRPHKEVLTAAVEELRDTGLSVHDHRVLQGICERLDGDERDLVERLLPMLAPRNLP